MKETREDWTYSEFRTYLLLYAANADFIIRKEEKDVILEESNNKEYKKILKKFENDSDLEKIKTIMSFREKYFSTEEEVEKLLDEVKEVLFADDEFHYYERNFLMFFKKLFKG